MALLRKFDEGGTTQDTEQQTEQTITPPVAPPVTPPVAPSVTPQVTQNIGQLTIQVYGEDYDVNALTKSINAGIRPYLRSLRCKDKDKKFVEQKIYEIWDAMLEDVADGKRVTYNGTHFTDYKGILKNAPKEKKDFVGMAAWYVGNILDNATPIEKPKSYDYAPWLVGSVVLRRLFGTSAGDDVGAGSLQDWFLMDEPGEDNIRGTDNRAQRFRDVLQEILNDPRAFDEYNWSPENVQKARNAVQTALNAATQNGLDPTDYSVFATNLGRFGTGAQGWNTLFMGDTRTPAELAEEKTKQEEEADKWIVVPVEGDDDVYIPRSNDVETMYTAWLDELYPEFLAEKETTAPQTIIDYIIDNAGKINRILEKLSVENLELAANKEMRAYKSNIGNILRSNGIDNKVIPLAILNYLYHTDAVKEAMGDGFIAFPNIKFDDNRFIAFNPNTGAIRHSSIRKLKSWSDARRKEFAKFLRENYNIPFHKQGGILTFKKGGEVGKYQNPAGGLTGLKRPKEDEWNWLNNFYQSYLDDLLKAGTDAEDKQEFVDKINRMQKRHYDMYDRWNHRSNPANATEGVNYDVKSYQNDIINHYPYVNTKGVEGAKSAGFYKYPLGAYTGDKKGENGKWQSDNWYSYQTDDRRVLPRSADSLTDDDISALQSKWSEAGYEIYLDPDTQYYMLRIPETRAPKKINATPPQQATNTGAGTGLSGENGEGAGNGNEEDDPSKVRKNYNQKDNSNKLVTQFGILGDYPANIIGAKRLITHLRGNNQTADILSNYYRYTPLKKSPYYYAPVLGDLPAEQRAQREKGSLIYDAWRNLTSDASVNLANLLERYKLGMQKEDEGAEKNTARRRETAKEALGFAQKNIENNINTANDNTKELVQTLQHLGEIKASNKEKNITAGTNWLSEMQKNLHTRAEERIALTREANNMGAYMNYQDELQKLETRYLNDDGTIDYNRMYKDPKYINAVRDLKNEYQLELLQNAMRRRFRSSYTYFSKKGGKLIKRKRR